VRAWALPALAVHSPWLAARLDIPRTVPRRVVALSFDDGPHEQGTPRVLDILAEHEATATFFLVGEQVERHPDLARAIVDAGHEVGLHGYVHRLVLRRRLATLGADLERGAEIIASAAHAAPRLYRPPYGVFSAGCLALVRERGWQPMLWSAWGRDWERRATAARIAARVNEKLRAGDVVLLHDSDAYSSTGSWKATVAALPSVLSGIAVLGLRASAITQST
jgi:peptidoglycan-N-acetylglucosamine deacetylase